MTAIRVTGVATRRRLQAYVAVDSTVFRNNGGARMRLREGAAFVPRSASMKDYFRRQLVYYAEAHRDHVNGVMHIVGNPMIFIGVVLPLCRVPVTLFGIETSLAPILVIPALLLWTVWDVMLGLAIVVSSIPLLFIAAAIAGSVSILWVWIIAVALFAIGWALQIVGHQVFEGKRPTLLDNPMQMLISPMYIFAKLFIVLGLRPDLAAVLRASSQPASLGTPANVGRNP